ncbi:MAG: aminotransferase class I/II-fold pyridoxal phosphate-dependent enzyme [Bdellovibrionaceae bacterium]|nr:aminotransferase class I/II-fold pyridoxal phosphate-dependent enzyme [Bdellovibrionales bacterium]MCB9083573.1 aminotransferase class I/II-fold pyridoxal phosphate-dependent enzyme [Pseudobdellovibrionaceae bacterium]
MSGSHILLNKQIRSLRESSTLAINQRVKDLRSQGQTVFHFGFGQSPFPVPAQIVKSLRDAADNKDYLPTLGLLPLRQAFCDHYQRTYRVTFNPDHVLIGPGSKELLFQALMCLEGPLILPAPSWVSYGPQAHICHKPVRVLATTLENSYKITDVDLEKACQEMADHRQKILILNSPSNPTGCTYSSAELSNLAPVLRKHRVLVIADEIYSLTAYDGQPAPSLAQCYPEGTIVSSGLSKGFSAGGYRLGVMAIPEALSELLPVLTALVSETYSCVSSPIQYAAVAAYQADPEINHYLRTCSQIHKVCGEYLYARFLEMGLRCPPPTGAFYLFPDFESYRQQLKEIGVTTSEQLCGLLLNEVKVALLPGSDFYMPETYLAVRVATVDYKGEELLRAAQQGASLDHKFVEQYATNLKNGCDRIQNFLQSLG